MAVGSITGINFLCHLVRPRLAVKLSVAIFH